MSSACQKAEVEAPVNEGRVLDATIENIAVTRTVMDEDNNIRWSEGDQIVGFMKSTFGAKFQVTGSSVGETSASFEEVSSDGLNAGTELDHIIAYYPYSSSVKIARSGSNYALDVVLPAEQTYVQESFANGAMPMVAVSETNNITFRNVCGGMKLQLKGTQKVASVKVEGKNGEILSGAAVVIAYTDGTKPSITMSDETSTSVTLNCGSGVQLNENDATEFIISLPPVFFSQGFTVTITDSDGETQTIETDKANEVKRSSILVMPYVTLESSDSSVSEGIDLGLVGTANCYIVSEIGIYRFTPTKGNSNESVGDIAFAETLWETFGTDVTPNVGDLVKNVKYVDGVIRFETPSTFKEGNAVIAAKDASGNILWSWHIWLTDQPEEQVYYNNAGTMMDRNLGATSATPGDVGALGLLYQWGRKDPFLGSSSISEDVESMSTAVWPTAIPSTSLTGTIEYATANPMSFISRNDLNVDWLHTGDYSTDNTRWKTYSENKSIYDPCPSGWRVPEGGDSGIGIWSRACGNPSAEFNYSSYDNINAGMDFSGKFGAASPVWYPAAGIRSELNGSLGWVNLLCEYWSATPSYSGVGVGNGLRSQWDGTVQTSSGSHLSNALSVRCVKESSVSELPLVVNLSVDGTANSYIVSETAIYEFFPVKGNSLETVGNVASVEVLWESFGTNTTPSVGDLVRDVSYSDGLIRFSTPSPFKEGNAVIAAKDASDNILWSWHIWLTDQPEEQVYYNNAGTMMDRNLGATSAIPGDVGALGLLYQWGRKDPFLGSSSINEDIFAKSTARWPSSVSSDSRGTIEYAISHPMTFISANESNCDWYYTGNDVTDNTRWTTSDKPKSIYDPCPVGWRVPDGGGDGIWSSACGSTLSFDGYPYDSSNEGMNFSGKFGPATTIWYPVSGFRNDSDGSLRYVGYYGFCWSASPSVYNAHYLYFYKLGRVYPSDSNWRAFGHSVRCLQE